MILYVVGYPGIPTLPHRERAEHLIYSFFNHYFERFDWAVDRKRSKREKTK